MTKLQKEEKGLSQIEKEVYEDFRRHMFEGTIWSDNGNFDDAYIVCLYECKYGKEFVNKIRKKLNDNFRGKVIHHSYIIMEEDT
jgi:hypothetical protein